MWLVSGCSQSGVNLVSSQPPKVTKPSLNNSTKTTELSTLSKLATVINTMTATQSPATTSSPPAESPITTNAALAVTTTPPATSATATTAPPPIITLTPTNTLITSSDIGSYLLDINGLVNNAQSLSYQQILAIPSTTQIVEIACPGVEYEVDQWTGVPLSTLLSTDGLSPSDQLA